MSFQVVRALLPGSDAVRDVEVALPGCGGTAPPPPEWQPTEQTIDMQALLQSEEAQFSDTVDLWIDNQDPASLSSLSVKVCVTKSFWAVCLRCFVRVNGVMARVLNTRFVCHTSNSHIVLRERSWREGNWEQMAGPGAADHVDFRGQADCIATERLPCLYPTVTEQLVLPASRVPQRQLTATSELWQTEADCVVWVCAGAGLVLVGINDGLTVQAAQALTGQQVWQRAVPEECGSAVAAVVSPSTDDGGRIAVGGDRGVAQVWRISSGEPLYSFSVVPESALNTNRSSTCRRWVEQLAWSSDGSQVAAAAGRDAVVLTADTAQVKGRAQTSGAVYALDFAGWSPTSPMSLAIAAYGTVRWCEPDLPPLEIGAAAVLCMSVAPDSSRLAVGCMDQRVRVFALDGSGSAVDWGGFSGPVKMVAWSSVGNWLAAAGGSSLLTAKQGIEAGAAPTLCALPNDCNSCNTGGFGAIAWSTVSERLLATVAIETRLVHLYDVGAADGSVPRQAAPLATFSLPGNSSSSLLELVFTREICQSADSTGGVEKERLVLLCGNSISVVQLDRVELIDDSCEPSVSFASCVVSAELDQVDDQVDWDEVD